MRACIRYTHKILEIFLDFSNEAYIQGKGKDIYASKSILSP